MRALILAAPAGTHLGSQDEVARRLGVGRATLEQASRILEHDGLLDVRRGVGGGYFGARPDASAVQRAVAIYLQVNETSFAKASATEQILWTELLRQAALSSDEEARDALVRFGDRLLSADIAEQESRRELDQAFQHCIFRLAKNALAELIVKVTFKLFLEEHAGDLLDMPDGPEVWRRMRMNMIRAIVERDADYVQILSRRFSTVMAERITGTAPQIRARDENTSGA